ncbi:MAG: cyclopropane fatty-acyl-phospholipid synthase-like methyltransferase [Bacteriovoracaceae bacterium]
MEISKKEQMKYLIILLLLTSCNEHKHESKHKHESAHHHKKHDFSDTKKWSKIFEDKKRDKWQKPNDVLEFAKIGTNSVVVDIGSATGYFPVRIAKIARKGRVWGIDVEPSLVNFLNERARKEGLSNLFSILGTYADPLLPEPASHIFIVDTYHHINSRVKYFKHLKTKLQKDGSLIVVDFKKGDLPFGPKDKMKLSAEKVIAELAKAGYKLERRLDTLPYQYVLLFK